MGLTRSVIGTKSQKEVLMEKARTGNVRVLFFVGPSGTGKTSAARIFAANFFGIDYSLIDEASYGDGTGYPYYMEKNASGERGIDVIRRLVGTFISTGTDNDKPRILVFDEADGLTPQAQNILRATTEQYSYNCIFIFCLNNIDKMHDALISRASIFYFDPLSKDVSVEWLLDKAVLSNITIGRDVAEDVVEYYRGDLRKVANSFISTYTGMEVTKWEPRPTYAEEIYTAENRQETYLALAEEHYIEAGELLRDLLRLNDWKNPIPFGQALLMIKADPMIGILYALNEGLK